MMKRKPFRALLGLGVSLSLMLSCLTFATSALANPAVNMSIVPATYTATVNEIFNVDIQLSGPDPVRGASAYIDFDKTKLEVQSITPGTALNIVLQNEYDNVAGTIDYSADKLTGTLPTGTFTLATIQLKALAPTTTPTPLTFVYEEPNRVTDVITTGAVSVLGTVTDGVVMVASVAPAGNMSIVPGTYTAVVNDTFTVDIELSGPDPVRGASAYIDFDETKLEVQSIAPGAALNTVLQNQYDNVAGTIDYSAGKLTGTLPTGTFTLATIEFRALAETSAPTPLTFVSTPGRVTDVITTGSVSVLGTVNNGEISISAPSTQTVNGQVTFQGRPAAPDASWVNSLTVVVLEQGTSTVVDTYAVTTNSTGGFSFVFDHAPGTYDIGVKGSHTLSRLEEDIVIDSAITNVDFGILLEGDCDNNDVVDISDFGIVGDAYGSVPASGNWDERADLNGDGVVDIYDFGLVADNFGLFGEMV
jgi:stage V sporulation protein SpoVS